MLTTARFIQYRYYIRRGILTSSTLITLLAIFGLVFLSVAYAFYVATS